MTLSATLKFIASLAENPCGLVALNAVSPGNAAYISYIIDELAA